MKASRIVPGPQGGRLEIHDVPQPKAGPGQVLVRVMASGLNRGEIKLVRDATGGEPRTSGVEFAGIVAATGPGVTHLCEGDHVVGHGTGGQAEFAVAEARALLRVPRSLPWAEAAAFLNVFITAHDALVINGELRPGETVLVNAASSGIGLAAIQIASLMKAAKVFATTRSAEKAARLARYGATHAIDVSTRNPVQAVMEATGGRGVDIVIDSLGGEVFPDNMKSLAVKGRLVNVGRMAGATAQMDLTDLWLKRLKLIGVTFRTRSEEERLQCIEAAGRDLLPLLEAGAIQLPVDRVYPLDRIAEAHAYMETGRHFGKIVIAVDAQLAEAAAVTA
ncbi:zinc-binding dehydrogenase [Variovorax sp. YR216]|uniref:zinc-binding dehydrogenase n=1 Tax=Variovorax sp. YR216 TaxID=1882828 RepID=UPI0008981209|nr:zinc-binding dehydrogenase [Variovorax sp. YR216]SEB22353.1 NADPH:quinone reductase [Variovorax sp. YR216]